MLTHYSIKIFTPLFLKIIVKIIEMMVYYKDDHSIRVKQVFSFHCMYSHLQMYSYMKCNYSCNCRVNHAHNCNVHTQSSGYMHVHILLMIIGNHTGRDLLQVYTDKHSMQGYVVVHM